MPFTKISNIQLLANIHNLILAGQQIKNNTKNFSNGILSYAGFANLQICLQLIANNILHLKKDFTKQLSFAELESIFFTENQAWLKLVRITSTHENNFALNFKINHDTIIECFNDELLKLDIVEKIQQFFIDENYDLSLLGTVPECYNTEISEALFLKIQNLSRLQASSNNPQQLYILLLEQLDILKNCATSLVDKTCLEYSLIQSVAKNLNILKNISNIETADFIQNSVLYNIIITRNKIAHATDFNIKIQLDYKEINAAINLLGNQLGFIMPSSSVETEVKTTKVEKTIEKDDFMISIPTKTQKKAKGKKAKKSTKSKKAKASDDAILDEAIKAAQAATEVAPEISLNSQFTMLIKSILDINYIEKPSNALQTKLQHRQQTQLEIYFEQLFNVFNSEEFDPNFMFFVEIESEDSSDVITLGDSIEEQIIKYKKIKSLSSKITPYYKSAFCLLTSLIAERQIYTAEELISKLSASKLSEIVGPSFLTHTAFYRLDNKQLFVKYLLELNSEIANSSLSPVEYSHFKNPILDYGNKPFPISFVFMDKNHDQYLKLFLENGANINYALEFVVKASGEKIKIDLFTLSVVYLKPSLATFILNHKNYCDKENLLFTKMHKVSKESVEKLDIDLFHFCAINRDQIADDILSKFGFKSLLNSTYFKEQVDFINNSINLIKNITDISNLTLFYNKLRSEMSKVFKDISNPFTAFFLAKAITHEFKGTHENVKLIIKNLFNNITSVLLSKKGFKIVDLTKILKSQLGSAVDSSQLNKLDIFECEYSTQFSLKLSHIQQLQSSCEADVEFELYEPEASFEDAGGSGAAFQAPDGYGVILSGADARAEVESHS